MADRVGRTRGRTSAVAPLLAAGLLAVAAAVTPPAQADDAGSGLAALADAARAVVDDASVQLVVRDGDFVVFGDVEGADAGPGDSDVQAKGSGAGGADVVVHDGYATLGEPDLLDRYEIRLVASEGIETVRAHLGPAADDAARAAVPLVIRPGTVRRVEPGHGQIDVVVSSTSSCSGSWLACGGPTIRDGVITDGRIWVNPRLLDRPAVDIGNALRHELGHTMGLAHYDHEHDGEIQVMHSRSFLAPAYRTGDLAGLAHLAGRPAPAPLRAPAAAPPAADLRALDPAASQPHGAVDLVSGGTYHVTVHGWAADPQTSAPIRVRIEVSDTSASIAADLPRSDVAAAHPDLGPDHGFRYRVLALPGAHEVCVTAVDPEGLADRALGCRTVTVGSHTARVGVQVL